MESEPGPGDRNAASCVVSSIDPQKADKTEGGLRRPCVCLRRAWPAAFTGTRSHLLSAPSRTDPDSSVGVSLPFIFKSILNYEEEDSLPCPFSR